MFLIGILFAEMLERRFPQQFKAILTNVTFNALYLYSKMQIKLVKWQINIINFIESNPTLSKIKTELDTIMKPRVVTLTQFVKNGEYLQLEDASNCDFALFSWLGDDKKCINTKIVYDINEPMTMVECSDIKFILVEIDIGENKLYKIDLKTDNYNFYLVGNKFTKQFFMYYLKQKLQANPPINYDGQFSLKILDHNINSLEISFTDKNESIVLEKSGYKIVNNE
jgi:hypothetical protein